jgi:2-keto-4-pentenoate hydratase
MAGGMTEAVAVSPGDTVVATFDRLGSVEIPFR